MYDPPKKTTNFEDVGNFHTKFGLASVTDEGAYPREVDSELASFRIKFMLEELLEFCESVGVKLKFEPNGAVRVEWDDYSNYDPAGAFDALLDLVYVAMGTAHLFGFPWQEGWTQVQEANISKMRAKADGSDSKRGSSYDVIKPPGWAPPDIKKILRKFGWITDNTKENVK